MTQDREALRRLADVHGVAWRYVGADDEPVEVPDDTVRAVLHALDVDPTDDRDAAREPWTVVAWQGEETTVAVPATGALEAVVRTEQGATEHLAALPPSGSGTVDLRVPPTLPLGAHTLTLHGDDEDTSRPLLVAPRVAPLPGGDARWWGWQVDLYALRSAASWGHGDIADLRALLVDGAGHGADFVLCNPLHAALPIHPQQNSPYSPASRRFTNLLYLRVEECDGFAALQGPDAERVRHLAAQAQAHNGAPRLDRNAALDAKLAALEVLAAQPLDGGRDAAFARWRAGHEGVEDFALACALAERHGGGWRSWPAQLHDLHGDAVDRARRELHDRVDLHVWIQWQCAEQIRSAQEAAQAAGMHVGLIRDLAVGVDSDGADGWALQDDLAAGVSVGAPPDAFNQQGQDWALPPLRPDRLDATGFASLRALVAAQVQGAGGVRIDHAMGLFRLFWIPQGRPPTEGTYVRYPAEGMLAAVTLESARAGAIVVGEDLGTVEEGVGETLRGHGIMGTSVAWFETTEDGERPLPAAAYPRLALTAVTTHDLPTARGWATDEATRVRARLGLLAGDEEHERETAARERDALLRLLVDEGVLATADADPEDVVDALHAFVARTPSALVVASLRDAAGDPRQPNLPGTVDEYPNWRLPYAEAVDDQRERDDDLLPSTRPLGLEELLDHPRLQRLARVLTTNRRRPAQAG